MATQPTWIIQAREGFAVGGETLEFQDASDVVMDLTDLSFTMRMTGYNRNDEFTIASGNFTLVPPVSPATVPTVCEFTMTVENVATLKKGDNNFELLIADQDDVLIGEMSGTIQKRN